MAHIFISYAKKDTRALAEALYTQLNQLDGITAWMDKSLEADASWAIQIQEEIDDADYIVVLLSKDVMRRETATQHRSFVLNEIDYAQQDRKPILPVLVERVKTPVQLAGVQHIDITKNPNNPEKIIQRIRQRFSISDESTREEDVSAHSNTPEQKSSFPFPLWMMGFTIVILIMGIWGLSSFFSFGNDDPQLTPETQVAQQSTFLDENATTPSPLEIAGMTQTREMANIQSTLDESNRLQATNEVLTATAFAPTRLAQQQATVNTILTQTRIASLALTPSNTPLPTATPDPAFAGVTRNDEWTPVEQDFDGVTMVLVPAGCFVMGNDSDSYNGKVDGGEQCFNVPFWIDKTEVSQADFERLGEEQSNSPYFDGENRPVENITWFDAHDFCASRGGRLPTEAEWEYVARGPDEWYFPWGNEFNSDNAVWNRDGSEGTANIASIVEGSSWVGTFDMSGNVWEWTASPFNAYPFDVDNEDLDNRNVNRVLRGGSWNASISNSNSLHSASRFHGSPSGLLNDNGFRCIRSYE